MKKEVKAFSNPINGDLAPKTIYDLTGSDLYRVLGGKGVSEQALQNQGLLGIRYLDQGSRDAGAGSSNFVVFQPDILRILERQ